MSSWMEGGIRDHRIVIDSPLSMTVSKYVQVFAITTHVV